MPTCSNNGIVPEFCRYRLAASPHGIYLSGSGQRRFRVVWLPHRSYWTTHFAAISLRQTDSKLRVLWFLRVEQAPDAWRRARVLLAHPPSVAA